MRDTIQKWFKSFQERLCSDLEACDGQTKFQEDTWERPGGGGGAARVIQNGAVFEKGGVNFSAVEGVLPEKAAAALLLPDPHFFATGVSVVMHPQNPHVPITHMNVRYFEAGNGDAWFGGGIDLTPIYVNKAQVQFFHQRLKNTCDRFQPTYYTEFKKWADDYFYIPHREETRGVGGIFFDRLTPTAEIPLQERFSFVQAVADTFSPTYTSIVNQNKNLSFSEQEKEWQLIRRGRYVEFNLVNDRGTKFGLETNGRTESILMSLPPLASWHYNHLPETGTPEAEALACFQKDIDWVSTT
ncbi:oxygen-dependent coproporphyrinogen oxidase [Rufibacter tibetensis]|uniref:coproporphyrinogen oxidase n=1 Tax=Rufibacter tibetensis TaxID=512763 RepID=A0A0P0CSU5_9BACT|nr:oxygen-dependent coproporphyrinogen oxidase [Rufibacter tibetensis]ALJ00565.1 coproporphyrinogen III oxidase [Rufibacter tibetensis]